MNLLSGLMAGANFGTGFIQGQQNAEQNNYAQQFNNIQLQTAQMQLQQMQQQQQARQKYLDSLLMNQAAQPMPANLPQGAPGIPSQPAAASSQQLQGTTDPQAQLAGLWDKYQKAADAGDTFDANQNLNAYNATATHMFQMQKIAEAQKEGELVRQQRAHALAGAIVMQYPATASGIKQAIAAIIADGSASQEEIQNLQAMASRVTDQTAPMLRQRIFQQGMTSKQQIDYALQQQRMQAQQQAQQFAQQQRMNRARIEAQRAAQAQAAAQRKEAQADQVHAPSREQVQLAQTTVERMFPDSFTSSVDSQSGMTLREPSLAGAQVSQDAAALAMQVMHRTKMAYPDALNLVLQQMKANGQIPSSPPPSGSPVGTPQQYSVDKYNVGVGSADNPIPIHSVNGKISIPAEYREIGKYYINPSTKQVAIWTDQGWQQVH